MSSASQSPRLVVLLIILSLSNPYYVAAQNPQMPPTINSLTDYLESLFPEEVEGRVINNSGNIEARFTIIDQAHPEVRARKIARDYIHAAYRSGLSIRSAKIVIIKPTGEIGLSVTVGANIASVYNWMDPKADPSVFMQWVKDISAQQPRGSGMERASLKNAINIKGPWSVLTPQNSANNKPNMVPSLQPARDKGGQPGAEAQGAQPTRNPLTPAIGVYRIEQSVNATPLTLQERRMPEILIRNPQQRLPLPPAAGALASAIVAPAKSHDEAKSLRIRATAKAIRTNPQPYALETMASLKNKDTKPLQANAPDGDEKASSRSPLEVRALKEKPAFNPLSQGILSLLRLAQPPQETTFAKSAAHINVASLELGRKTTGSLNAHSSAAVLDELGKLDQAVPVSGTGGSNLTSVEPEGSSATKESPTISDSGRAKRNEDSTATERSANNAPSSSSANPAPPKEVALTDIYRIGVGDVLDIRLLNSAISRSTLYTVIDGGLIDLPIAGGPIAVGGLTVDEIRARVASELKRRAVEEGARVSVGVRHYASHSVVITGLVHHPGSKILRREAVPLYVIMAEAQARLDAGRITIIRPGSAGTTVDLSDPAALNLIMRPGDTISVTARLQEFYFIAGGINYPGQKVFEPGVTLLQAILAAGGFRRQSDNRIDLWREGQNGLLATTTFKLKEIKAGKVADPLLNPGDRIEVSH
ncbi:MAG: polysaccharide biosynthesis/export family protein [Pyrinomonadaceae bacterium]|nr:polysaccharide biosynthesis/export family protein [Pyrinomonadaceae bacterium]